MIDQESKLDSSIRMDVVSIVTPNHVHFDPAFKALNKGFPVIIDKPMTYDSNEALKLVKVVNETGFPFAVTHTYTGYPMVKEAKQLIQSGKIGKLRKVAVEYPQGWLTSNLESTKNKTEHLFQQLIEKQNVYEKLYFLRSNLLRENKCRMYHQLHHLV